MEETMEAGSLSGLVGQTVQANDALQVEIPKK
jgi:hypothetical protein